MNIPAQPVSFLPISAAQPTDVLRRDNAIREVITPLKSNEAFHRERGLGSDSERRSQAQERSYAQQVAQARVEAGFPYFIKRVERQPEDKQQAIEGRSQADQGAPTTNPMDDEPASAAINSGSSELQQALERSRLQRDEEPLPLRYQAFAAESSEWSLADATSVDQSGAPFDPAFLERGQRIEHYYQSSFRPVEHFLLGVA